jgi:3,4-dihydroxy-2-butanone 4-phosphate synthase
LTVGLPRAPIDVPLADLAAGRMVLLCDDLERGGEGDLLVAADFADAAAINFMASEARGLVCLALGAERCEDLGLEEIGSRGNASSLGDSSMVSIEARRGVTTGISAADRARTIAVAVDPMSGPEDLSRPGHVFPLRARRGGVLERPGWIEAAVDLAVGAGLKPAVVRCQVLRDDGRVATGADLEAFAARHGLAVLTVSQVVAHRRSEAPAGDAEAATTGRRMRDVMGHFATGVSVVTARDTSGSPRGATANAISSVSLEPPLLLVCLSDRSGTLAAIRADGRFAVNVLAAEQRHHSDRFARNGDLSRVHEVEFEDHPLGLPVLPGALATIACEVEAIHPAGDHEIVVGRARHLEHREPGAEPLLFYRGSYSQLHIEEDDLAV